MNLENQFDQYIKERQLFSTSTPLIAAVSGGVDSVVLCHLLKRGGFQFAVAHCNFLLRGKESHDDEQFVRALAEKLHVQVFVCRNDARAYATANKLNIQDAARKIRYEFFADLVQAGTGKIVLTAHHANDAIETILMHFFEGTGINGLKGIEPKIKLGAWVARPLLFAKKEALLTYAFENNLSWVTDSSNDSVKYRRNFIRNEVLPLLKKQYPSIEQNLIGNLQRFREVKTLYDLSVSRLKKSLMEANKDAFQIPVMKLLKTPAYETVLFEMLLPFGFTGSMLPEILNLLHAETGRYVSSSTHRVLRNRNWLLITENTSAVSPVVVDEPIEAIHFGGKIFNIQLKEGRPTISSNEREALLDARDITFPLILRRWKKGDYFYPLGLGKKKKLSRFFIDNKLSLHDKENVLVLECNKKILWVVGHRIDDRYKILPSTVRYLRITML